jgi:hypothetical protein
VALHYLKKMKKYILYILMFELNVNAKEFAPIIRGSPEKNDRVLRILPRHRKSPNRTAIECDIPHVEEVTENTMDVNLYGWSLDIDVERIIQQCIYTNDTCKQLWKFNACSVDFPSINSKSYDKDFPPYWQYNYPSMKMREQISTEGCDKYILQTTIPPRAVPCCSTGCNGHNIYSNIDGNIRADKCYCTTIHAARLMYYLLFDSKYVRYVSMIYDCVLFIVGYKQYVL